jgi:hypothetical protein
VNGKLYIGVTDNPKSRMKQHLYNKNQNKNSVIRKAVNKYGPDNFNFEVICIGSKDYIYDLEVKTIALYNTMVDGYNILPGGIGGAGGKVRSRSDDSPIYVSGFWFPNKRTAISSTNISPNVYEKRRQDGTLGDYPYLVPRKSNSTALRVPNYFKGFWFPDLFVVSDLFDITPESARQRVLRGYVEQNDKKSKNKIVRKYFVLGEAFTSLEEASEFHEIPLTTIKNRISKGVQNYEYTYEIQER